jgi:hypothetical protein
MGLVRVLCGDGADIWHHAVSQPVLGQKLTLNHDVLRFPASVMRSTITEIPLAGIEAMEVRTENKNTFLAIWHANGYDVVFRDRFPGKAAFENFVSAIYERAPAVKLLRFLKKIF